MTMKHVFAASVFVGLLGLSHAAKAQEIGLMLHNQSIGLPNSGKVFGWNVVDDPTVEYDYGVTLGTNDTLVGAGDFNGDGWFDGVVTYGDSQTIDILYFEASTHLYSRSVTQPLPAGHQVVGVADFDGDGTPDLLVQAPNAHLSVWIMGGDSGEEFEEEIYLGNPKIGGVDRFAGFADVDNDGMADVVLSRTKKDLVYWQSTGSGVVMNGLKPARIPLLTYLNKKRLHGLGRTCIIGSLFFYDEIDDEFVKVLVVRENKPDNRYSVWAVVDEMGSEGFANQQHFRNASFKKPVAFGIGF